MKCPNCGFEETAGALECRKCSVIFAKLPPTDRQEKKQPEVSKPFELPKLILAAAGLLTLFAWSIHPNTVAEGAGGYWLIFVGKISLASVLVSAAVIKLLGTRAYRYFLMLAAVFVAVFVSSEWLKSNSVAASGLLPNKYRVPILIKALNHDNKNGKAAILELADIGAGDRAVVDALTSALSGKNRLARNSAAKALGKMGKAVVPELIPLLRDSRTSYQAAIALAGIGPDAVEAVPELTELLNRNLVRREEYAALGRAGLIPMAEKDDGRKGACVGAAGALGAIGPAAKEAVPVLREAMKDSQEVVRMMAESALKEIGAEVSK